MTHHPTKLAADRLAQAVRAYFEAKQLNKSIFDILGTRDHAIQALEAYEAASATAPAKPSAAEVTARELIEWMEGRGGSMVGVQRLRDFVKAIEAERAEKEKS